MAMGSRAAIAVTRVAHRPAGLRAALPIRMAPKAIAAPAEEVLGAPAQQQPQFEVSPVPPTRRTRGAPPTQSGGHQGAGAHPAAGNAWCGGPPHPPPLPALHRRARAALAPQQPTQLHTPRAPARSPPPQGGRKLANPPPFSLQDLRDAM